MVTVVRTTCPATRVPGFSIEVRDSPSKCFPKISPCRWFKAVGCGVAGVVSGLRDSVEQADRFSPREPADLVRVVGRKGATDALGLFTVLHNRAQFSTAELSNSSCQEKRPGLFSRADWAGKPKKLNGTIERGRSRREAVAPSIFFGPIFGAAGIAVPSPAQVAGRRIAQGFGAAT